MRGWVREGRGEIGRDEMQQDGISIGGCLINSGGWGVESVGERKVEMEERGGSAGG